MINETSFSLVLKVPESFIFSPAREIKPYKNVIIFYNLIWVFHCYFWNPYIKLFIIWNQAIKLSKHTHKAIV